MSDVLDDLDPETPLGWLREYVLADDRDPAIRDLALNRLRALVVEKEERALYIEGYDEALMGPKHGQPTARQWLHRYIAGDYTGPKSINDHAHEKVEEAIADAVAEGRRVASAPTTVVPVEVIEGWTQVSVEAWREDATGTIVALVEPSDRTHRELFAYVAPKYEWHVFDLLAKFPAPSKRGLLTEALNREAKRPNATHDGACATIAKVLPVPKEADLSRWTWRHCWSLYTKGGHEAATIWPNRDGYSWHTWDSHGIGGENSCARSLDVAATDVITALRRQGYDHDALGEYEEEIRNLEADIEAYRCFADNVAASVGLLKGESMIAIESEVMARMNGWSAEHEARAAEHDRKVCDLTDELARLRAVIHTPHTDDWIAAVPLEAAYQIDAGKAPQDWFWLLGYLGGKALHAAIQGDVEKAKHHTISTGAALLNWHRALTGEATAMRPGIKPPE